jgi:glycine/D-amino acid oxidase-like deaminating enzyme
VIACGIWGPSVAALAGVTLPLVPVTHPYVYSAQRAETHPASPLVRWPEFSVYARDHGDRDGLGTSNHDPLEVPNPGATAHPPWPGGILDSAVASALELMPAEHRWRPEERIGGLQSVTPDRLPLVGPWRQVEGVWSAEALWITHAAGAAKALTRLMFDEPTGIDHLRPDRFGDREHEHD